MIQKTGWQQLVRGVHQPGRPTCNGKVYDVFVSSRGIAEAVVGVAVVEDTGISPHSPARLFLRRRMRELRVRTIKCPTKLPGSLPAGCPPEAFSDDAGIAKEVSGHLAAGDLMGAVGCWFSRVEVHVTQIMGLSGPAASRASGRAAGCRMIWKPALTKHAAQRMRVSLVTTAWQSAAAWLLDILRGLGPPNPGQARAAH